jgi:DNA-binding XRE family transcriptional regulator
VLSITSSSQKSESISRIKLAIDLFFEIFPAMATKGLLRESELAALAKKYRVASGLNKVEAAAALGVTPPTVHLAEEDPEESLTKLRRRMIEMFSPFKIAGPFYQLQRK